MPMNNRMCVFWIGTPLFVLVVLLIAFQYLTVGAAGVLTPSGTFLSITN